MIRIKKKVVIIVAICVVLFSAVLVAALNAVFTVTKIECKFVTYSQDGETDSKALQKELEEQFVGSNTTFLDLEEVGQIVAKYSAFELISAEKSYPQTVLLQVRERAECFSFQRENGQYAVLDKDGLFLRDKGDNSNRQGGENLLLSGFSFATSEIGVSAQGEYFSEILILSAAFEESFGSVRSNVVSITKERRFGWGEFFKVEMREGVTLIICEPKSNSYEKMKSAVEVYQSLTQSQKMYGYIDITDSADGSAISVGTHSAQSEILNAPIQ